MSAATQQYREENPEVLYSDAAITAVNASQIRALKELAADNERRRVRLCTHHGPADKLHEMLIVHERSAYVPPHKHPGKSESTHVIEGEVDVVVFDEHGSVTRVIEMGDYASGKTFYYRMASPEFHTLIIRSDVLVFHETTDGPFDKKDTVFATWAPAAGDDAAARGFLSALTSKVDAMRTTPRQ